MNPMLDLIKLPADVRDILLNCPSYQIISTIEELVPLSCGNNDKGYYEVSYEIEKGVVVTEAKVCRIRNGIAINYTDAYMRRRDPDCMVIADDSPTDKPHFRERFGQDFSDLRKRTLEWLKTQKLIVFFFRAGGMKGGMDAVVVVPANAAFFAFGLALLQGILDASNLPEDFNIAAVVYVAPPFRHTFFDGKQVVVHNRTETLYEMFSYNLYPGPSAKKGVYGMLINLGEQEDWVTIHCSAVQVITPYDNKITIVHEGASGGGKSEMLEYIHREKDGRILLGRNVVSGEDRYIVLPRGCRLKPVVDDMAICHPRIQKENGKLWIMDAEQSWFVRVNHIRRYGTDPNLEEMTIHSKVPLLFLNIDVVPGGTALIWDHIEDEPGKPCPNPRVILHKSIVEDVIKGAVGVDIRSFGFRTPPCTATKPTYGIIGLFHVIPPALAWLWRLVAPRGDSNPSIVDSEGMSSEGVGSYWPFATGRQVSQANLLLKQISETHNTSYIISPNQHVGSWKVGFMPQWLAREYMARRGIAKWPQKQLLKCRCPLLGYAPRIIMIEGQTIPEWFFHVEKQTELGQQAYDEGALMLENFFKEHLATFLEDDLHPLGRRIIECCMDKGSLDDYMSLINFPIFSEDD